MMQPDRYPLKMEKRLHGDLVARNAQEEAAYEGMGWIARPDTPPEYEALPCWLRGPGLPDRLVNDGDEARQAAAAGYILPSDLAIDAGREAFAAAFTLKDENYEPAQYPKHLSHPAFVPEAPARWRYDRHERDYRRQNNPANVLHAAYPQCGCREIDRRGTYLEPKAASVGARADLLCCFP
jgi:hypothetical protein